MPANSKGCPYDLFVSYRHIGLHKEWLKDIFLPQFEPRLAAELEVSTNQLEVYWDDDLRTGEDWTAKLLTALGQSCCMLGIWSAPYFKSPWCLAEWRTFSSRAQQLGLHVQTLIAPVQVQDGTNYPPEATVPQLADFREFLITGEGFKKSELYVSFQLRVQELAEDVAHLIAGSPLYDPKWPLVKPADVHPGASPAIQRMVLGEPK